MTGKDLAASLRERESGMTHEKAQRIVKSVFEIIGESVGRGEDVAIHQFGTFKVVERTERAGHNPRTGEAVTIPASKGVKFKPTPTLKNSVKQQQ